MKYKKIDYFKIGDNLKVERLKKNLSRESLGNKCNLSGATICNIEINAENALFRNVVAIAKALDIRIEDILY